MDFPSIGVVPPPVLTTFHIDGRAGYPASTLFGSTSSAWPTANLALYYPFRLYSFATAYQLLVLIGATSTGNVDVGIYDAQKNLIVSSGSTACGAINTVQEFDITNTVLAPGDYMLGLAFSTNTATTFVGTAANDELILGGVVVYEEASAMPLPSTATPVVTTLDVPRMSLAGIQFRSVF